MKHVGLLPLFIAFLTHGVNCLYASERAELLWPSATQCLSLAESHPLHSTAAVLSERADTALHHMEQSDLHARLLPLRQKNRFQEMAWLLNDVEHPDGALLTQALTCYLLLGDIIRESSLPGGSTLSKHVYYADLDLEGVFKPDQFNYSANIGSEIGAYRIDRLLNLNIVPTTIKRSMGSVNTVGSLQYFVKDGTSAAELPEKNRRKSPEILVLDYLTKNVDRDAKNYMYHPLLNRFIAIDNGWCLRDNNIFARMKAFCIDKRTDKEKRREFDTDQRPAARLIARLEALTEDAITSALNGVVDNDAITKLIKRKPKILRSLAP